VSELFIHPNGQWTNDQASAACFSSSLQALDYVLKHHLQHSQIRLAFENPRMDLVLPVSEECGKQPGFRLQRAKA
jgi:hypothetical protein